MKRPAVFFDRDNTLIVSDGYLGNPDHVVLVEGAADAVARARQYGFKAITFSNQSGVARGLFTEQDVQAVNQRMDELLQQANPSAVIEHHEYCPYHPDAVVEQYRQDSFLRKPKPGMILNAAEALNLDLSRSWVIGDAPRDIEAGRAAGCRTILFCDPLLPPSSAAEVESQIKPDFTASTLKEAIQIIARESLCKPIARPRPPAAQTVPPTAATATSVDTDSSPDDGESNAQAHSDTEDLMDQEQATPASASNAVASGAPALAASPPATSPSAAAQPTQTGPLATQSGFASPKAEKLLEQILSELRRREEPPADFSVSKLLAGIVQILTLGVLFLAYLNREDPNNLNSMLMFAVFLQTFTIALLIMGTQK